MGDEIILGPDERAAIRSFLQRSEVRLSTLHRTVTALLSGAGVLVLLPALGRDSVVNVLRSLFSGADSPLHLTLAGMVVVALLLALLVLWLLFYEITRFYFHANHVESDRGTTFTPRFTLTSLHIPADELSPGAAATLEAHRRNPGNIELLVPSNDRARRSIDAQVAAYPGLQVEFPPTDSSRAGALLRLAAVKDRTLLDEVAKVEYGMARHVLRVQVIVLRYIKALFVVIVTSIEVYLLAGVVAHSSAVDTAAERWIVASLMLWAPAVLFVSSSPVRWLGELLRSEGAGSSGVRRDRELTRVDRVVSAFSVFVMGVAIVCSAILLTRPSSLEGVVAFVTAGLVGIVLEIWLVVRARA